MRLRKLGGVLLIAATLLTAREITVQQAVEWAMTHNKTLAQFKEQLSAAEAASSAALALEYPELSYSREGMDANQKYDEIRWTLSQSIEFPNKPFLRKQQARLQHAAKQAQYEEFLLELRTAVKVTYVDLLTRRNILRLRHRELNLAQLFQKAVEERIVAGISPEFERIQAEIQLAQAKNSYEEARWTFHSQRYELFTLIGLDADEQGYDIQFPDSLIYTRLKIPQKDALDGVVNQPLMRYYELLEKIADKEISLAKSQLLPDLSVGIFTQDINGESRKKGFEAGLSLPLWYPLVQKGQTSKARAEKRSVE
ncbi:MAG TPA: TolC family protein, partial [Candidatus Marinimicrobia bacterium]|nr:TolC family protein [Candidatus Neomarinimicrobiota bacterium]